MQEQIHDALRRGANDEALAAARAAVEAAPDSAEALHLLAMALNATGDRIAALQAIDAALALAPERSELHLQRASLSLGTRDVEAAQAALAQSVALDPNQFDAYLMQAQIALGRGDVDEAERLGRLAERVSPNHPRLQALQAMTALNRGNADAALSLLTEASRNAPEEPQVVLGLALAYAAKGHHAFAEQAMRKLLEKNDQPPAWRVLLAQTLQAQRRPGDALEALKPALSAADASVPLLRMGGELALQIGQPQQALEWLRTAMGRQPRDMQVLSAAMAAWQQLGAVDDAAQALDAALATTTDVPGLWQARVAVASDSIDAAGEVIARWNQAMPGEILALEAQMQYLQQRGEATEALALAERILAQEAPGNVPARVLVVEDIKQRDPKAAVAHVADLLPQAKTEQARIFLTEWLGMLADHAGLHSEAVGHWTTLALQRQPQQLPLPPVSLPPDQVPAGAWPEMKAPADGDAADFETLFLWGAPGSCVESVASQLVGVQGFRSDRLSPQAPDDGFQRFASVIGLSGHELDAKALADEWRAHLPARGIQGQRVVEWLVWWDNAQLRVLRPHIDKAGLAFVVRDPRDMFLQWLAFGSPMQIGMPSLQGSAEWLAATLSQAADVVQGGLYRAALLKIDGIEHDVDALRATVTGVLGSELPPGTQPPTAHFIAGHWRQYADALAGPFAALTPIAVRLGYPEA